MSGQERQRGDIPDTPETEYDGGSPNDAAFEALLASAIRAAYGAPEPSPQYRERLNALASAEARGKDKGKQMAMDVTTGGAAAWIDRRRMLARFGWATGAAGLAGAAVGLYFLLTPREAVAREAVITRVTNAAAQARTAYIHQWRPLNGARETEREFWYSASVGAKGAWRVDGDTYATLQRDGKFYFHTRTLKEVSVSETPVDLPPVSASERLSRLRDAGLLDRVSLLPDAIVDGKPAKRLRIELPLSQPNTEPGFYPVACPLRATVAVDPNTDLPFRTETEAYYKDQWRLVRVEEATYNQPVDPALFATDFPGATVLTLEQLRKKQLKIFREGIANGLKVKVGAYSVTLRGLDGTELGDVYLLYSVPPGSPLPRVALRDQTARTWRNLGGGMVGRILPELGKTWTLPDGERLCMALFRNEKPMTDEEGGVWKARFTFSGPQGGTSDEVSPDFERIGGGAIPREDCYREIPLEAAANIARACRDRAAAFADGRWKADAGLLRIALKGEFSPRHDQQVWEAEARRVEALGH